ncbi:MAG: hypothetical protein ACRELA_12100, partial [Candidatus Rokuibacteriota bacterium]
MDRAGSGGRVLVAVALGAAAVVLLSTPAAPQITGPMVPPSMPGLPQPLFPKLPSSPASPSPPPQGAP